MKWFKHDSDANLDAKLQNVLLDYGLEGYGLYWYCLELIVGKVNQDNITFQLEHDARIIARNTGSTVQKVEEMMRYFVEQNLFESTDGVVTCLRLAKRLDKSMTSNPNMRQIIELSRGHDGVMTQSCKNRLDKTRLDKNKDTGKAKRFSPPSLTEVSSYCVENNHNIQPEAFIDFYESKNWYVGKNKMKDWQAAVRNWSRRNEGNTGNGNKQKLTIGLNDYDW